MTTPDDFTPLREKAFSDAISQLEELLDQGGKAFLLGAGCSKCAGLPQMAELTGRVLASHDLDGTARTMLEELGNLFDGAPDVNIEDYLSELIDLLAIADRRRSRNAGSPEAVLGGSTYSADQLMAAVAQIKLAISSAIDTPATVEIHRRFVSAVHRPRRPGRSTLGQPVDYLILNYDTLIEDALALERLPFSDGMEGGSTAWWRPATLERADLAARVFKLHGSINWRESPRDSLPLRIAQSVRGPSPDDRRIMIWPASTKYRETQLDPYAQLAERVRQSLRPSHGSQRLLLVCGYRFGDAHINLEIDGALRESDGRLTVAVFTSEREPQGKLREWIEDPSVQKQVLVYAKGGFFHGADSHPATADLPWWTFENMTRLLEGDL